MAAMTGLGLAVNVLGTHDLTGLLYLLAAIGGGAAFLSVGRQGTRIKQLREDRDDRDKRITFLENENERHEAVEHQQEQRIEGLQSEVRLLRDVVTGASGPHRELLTLVETLGDLVRAHNDAAMTGLGEVKAGQGDILRLLGTKRSAEGGGN